jgi:5-methylcytosine-specific restriction endonuclease McrA
MGHSKNGMSHLTLIFHRVGTMFKLLEQKLGYCRYCGGKVSTDHDPTPTKRRFWCSKLCYCSYIYFKKLNFRRKFIWLRDKKICVVCGVKLSLHKKYLRKDRQLLEVHHIVAKINGGTDEPSNLEARCPICHLIETKRLIETRTKERRKKKESTKKTKTNVKTKTKTEAVKTNRSIDKVIDQMIEES